MLRDPRTLARWSGPYLRFEACARSNRARGRMVSCCLRFVVKAAQGKCVCLGVNRPQVVIQDCFQHPMYLRDSHAQDMLAVGSVVLCTFRVFAHW